MKIYHDCKIPNASTPIGINRVVSTYRCECGEFWKVTHYYGTSMRAERIPMLRFNFRHYKWQRRAKKNLK